jgi:hypothetical protein
MPQVPQVLPQKPPYHKIKKNKKKKRIRPYYGVRAKPHPIIPP